MINLLCTVRNCSKPLIFTEKRFFCPSRHSFDVASSGYVNLLQPQDRRSLKPGDSLEAVTARRRLLLAGQDSLFITTMVEIIKKHIASQTSKLLDVGCGEGTYLKKILENSSFEGCGLDISTPAINLAAKQFKKAQWVIANADRFLPFPDQEFDIVMSITARKNSKEFQRILQPNGLLLVVIPASDDLIELREKVLGEGLLVDRKQQTVDTFATEFDLVDASKITYKCELEKYMLTDLLVTTYRGLRYNEQERFATVEKLEVTFSRQVLIFKPK